MQESSFFNRASMKKNTFLKRFFFFVGKPTLSSSTDRSLQGILENKHFFKHIQDDSGIKDIL